MNNDKASHGGRQNPRKNTPQHTTTHSTTKSQLSESYIPHHDTITHFNCLFISPFGIILIWGIGLVNRNER